MVCSQSDAPSWALVEVALWRATCTAHRRDTISVHPWEEEIQLADTRRITLRSLRTRIVLLALFATLLLVAAGASFYFFLNSSQRARLDSAQKNLNYLATEMRKEYTAQLTHGVSLKQVQPPAPPPPPPKPPAKPPPPPHLLQPAPDSVELPLVNITMSVLRHDPDVEGGFYAAGTNVLAGYAFPTHEGPGGRGEIPGKERPEIEELAQTAVRTGELQQQSFHGAYDAILFVAVPIKEGSEITGAAWLMQRMPGLEAGRSQQLLLGSIGFTAAALICALLTFFITSEVSTGVQTVLTRLGVMEGALGEHPERPKPQLAEFEQVLQRVDELSDSLKQKIEAQRALEDEMRHRQRLSSLGQFAAGVAHELRNPLATIRLRTQMSQRVKDEASIERNSTVVLEEIARLDSMIERLLYFSRPIRLHLERISVGVLCCRTVDAWQARCQAESIDLQCHVREEIVACCDASKVRQVLDNLLENALQSFAASGPETRAIELCGRSEAEMILIEVRDTGRGLVPDAVTHALEPFFTTKDTGTGLGLSISYEIMQAHGGDLQLRNGVSSGAVATLCLPVAGAACEGK